MAYVKVLPIAGRDHLKNLVQYVQQENKTAALSAAGAGDWHLRHLLTYAAQPDKTDDGRLVTCVGCQLETAYTDFAAVREVFGNHGTLLTHQLVQSFAPGETSPEVAHQLGVQLAERMLPGYQYTVCTHLDREHIHNHIVFNAVSGATGQKYHGNKASLRLMQDASDALCREQGLSVIEPQGGGLDRDTYELARKGHSWKARLASDLDALLAQPPPPSMEAFVAALRGKGYVVKVSERHIMVTKIGEQKGIRLDTLARQFGGGYAKANIELWLRGKPPEALPTHRAPPDETASVWQQQERALPGNTQKTTKPAKKYAKPMTNTRVPMALRRFGNISRERLCSVGGETVTMTMTAEQARQFAGMGIYYSGFIRDSGDIAVSFKAVNAPLVERVLGLEKPLKSIEERQDERTLRERLNDRAAQLERAGTPAARVSWSCTVDELRRLDAAGMPYDYCRMKSGYRVGLLDADLPAVCKVLGWNLAEKQADVAARAQRMAYRALKQEADRRGTRLAYRVMPAALLEQLRAAAVPLAAYEKGEAWNVALLPDGVAAYERMRKLAERPGVAAYERIRRQGQGEAAPPASPEQQQTAKKR